MANNQKPKTDDKPRKYCGDCGKNKLLGDFYVSNNKILFPDGRLSICKVCLKKNIYDANKIIDINKFKNILQQMDIPFIYDVYERATNNKADTIGMYFKDCLSLPQYSNLRWKDSVFEKDKNKINNDICDLLEEENISKPNDFKVTQEMIDRWGSKHEKDDYRKLENFYTEMKNANTIETPQDISYLKKLAVISVRMDAELEAGNYDQAKKLGDLYSKYMADSKFRAMDKTDADKTGGIRNFCTIYAESEKDDFIPPWEYYRKIKGINQDIVDKTIMHIENFTLKLNKIEKMTEPPSDCPKLDKDEFEEE